MTEENNLRVKTEALVADLLDTQMKSNIMQFLWWTEYTKSVHSFQDFLDFLFVVGVKSVLEEMNPGLYNEVVDIAREMKQQVVEN